MERVIGKNEKLESFSLKSPKLESWKEPSDVGKNRAKLESFDVVGKFWLKLESLNELGKLSRKLETVSEFKLSNFSFYPTALSKLEIPTTRFS